MAHRDESRERMLSAMKAKGFDVLTNYEGGTSFFKVLSASAGSSVGLRAYYDNDDGELSSDPVVGLAAVELVDVTDRQKELGIADRVESRQSFEPLVLVEGGIELAAQTSNYLGVAFSDDEARANWAERVRARRERGATP